MNQLRRLVDSPAFTASVVAVILANALVLGLQTYPRLDEEYGDTLHLLNGIFLAFFVVEITLRVAAYLPRPWNYFREGWNVFDFLAVGLAFVPGLRENTTILRLARLARIVRVVHLLPDVRILITAVVRSLPPLASMAILTTLILFVYGMVGWQLFGDHLAEDWGTIGEAMLTLFVMLTLENFPVYMDAGMDVHPWSWIFFVSFILTAAFIVINVLIGIVLNSMEEARELARRESLSPEEAVPVLERIQYLRSALDQLEQELAAGEQRE
ncbi:MAG TPA: ion transporter [Gaiellaceae bacterium]|nr:ion transporter [Gaiellaceae bacterium]HET8652563.1 ion transporter [Gaiellaceae bacterium]